MIMNLKIFKSDLKILLRKKRVKLERAFDYLKVRTRVGGPEEYRITYEIFLLLIRRLYPNKDERKIRILFKVLDTDGTNTLSK